MTNNDVLRRMRYTFDFSDSQMMEIYKLAGENVSRSQVSDWLKSEADENYLECDDKVLAAFLNGLIVFKRGKKDDSAIVNESELTNNMIFNKIKIALSFKSTDILDLLSSVDAPLSNHELSAFFRKPEHKNYRHCNDQILRKFLQGLQHQIRPKS